MIAGNSPKTIFVLCHTRVVEEGDPEREDDDTKELYYSISEKECAREIGYYKNLDGFRDHPDGFRVMRIELNKHYWETGFITERI